MYIYMLQKNYGCTDHQIWIKRLLNKSVRLWYRRSESVPIYSLISQHQRKRRCKLFLEINICLYKAKALIFDLLDCKDIYNALQNWNQINVGKRKKDNQDFLGYLQSGYFVYAYWQTDTWDLILKTTAFNYLLHIFKKFRKGIKSLISYTKW